MEITSLQNNKIKAALHLKNRKDRDETGLFLIEGFRELSRAILGNIEIVQLFFSKPLFLGTHEDQLIDELQKRGSQIFSCSESAFSKLSYRDRPDGLVAIAKQRHGTLQELGSKIANKTPFLLIVEAIEKPGNLGMILRSADAVGVDAVIVCDRCTDLFNPNVVRASVGTLFTQLILETSSQCMLEFLRAKSIQIVAATPHAKQMYTQTDLKGPIAIVMGTEQLGLSKIWMDQAEIQASIPMLGIADSLNVGAATTLMLYEALRQRSI